MDFKFDSFETETVEDLNVVKKMIETILYNRFSFDNEKQQLFTYDSGFVFSCPYCGDSTKTSSKKRGNFYFDTKRYICFNGECGVEKNYRSFFEDMKFKNFLSSDTMIPKMNIVQNNNNNNQFVNHSLSSIYDFSELSNNYGLSVDQIKKIYSLKEIYYSDKLYSYLENRNIKPDKRFYYNNYGNIFILNINNESGKVISLQIRNFESDIKYINLKLKNFYKKAHIDFDESDEKLNFINRISRFYNFTNIDTCKKILVVEGSLDSILLPNCFALCGLGSSPINSKDVYYILDYDTPGKKKAMELLSDGVNVFLWKKFLDDNNIEYDTNKLDVTDLSLKNVNLKKIYNYFSSNVLDGMYLW